MNDWCVSRNMSWEMVGKVCEEHKIGFMELPVAGPNFLNELAQVSQRVPPFLPSVKR